MRPWTQEQETAIIEKVIKNHKGKTFDIFDSDDIANEIWIICTNGIKSFDVSKIKAENSLQALENFLNTHVRNRLANLYRDKRGNKLKPKAGEDEFSHNLRLSAANPTSLTPEFDVPFEDVFDDDYEMFLSTKVFSDFDLVDLELYYSENSNVNIGNHHRQKLQDFLKMINWVNNVESR